MTAMQHVCAWVEAEDARFEVCGCGMWRWNPVVAEAAANAAYRKLAPPVPVAALLKSAAAEAGAAQEVARKVQEVLRTPRGPICGPNGLETTNHARPTEGMTA